MLETASSLPGTLTFGFPLVAVACSSFSCFVSLFRQRLEQWVKLFFQWITIDSLVSSDPDDEQPFFSIWRNSLILLPESFLGKPVQPTTCLS